MDNQFRKEERGRQTGGGDCRSRTRITGTRKTKAPRKPACMTLIASADQPTASRSLDDSRLSRRTNFRIAHDDRYSTDIFQIPGAQWDFARTRPL